MCVIHFNYKMCMFLVQITTESSSQYQYSINTVLFTAEGQLPPSHQYQRSDTHSSVFVSHAEERLPASAPVFAALSDASASAPQVSLSLRHASDASGSRHQVSLSLRHCQISISIRTTGIPFPMTRVVQNLSSRPTAQCHSAAVPPGKRAKGREEYYEQYKVIISCFSSFGV